MLRSLVCAAVALTLFAGVGPAEEKKKKNTMAAGTIKKIDAKESTITVTVKKKNQTEDKEFKVEDATKFVIFAGEDKKEATGKEAFKNDAVKDGAPIAIISDPAGKIVEIRVGTPVKKK